MEEFAAWLIRQHPSTILLFEKFAPVLFALTAALVASAIAFGQLRISRSQWRTARDKLKFDLFERRYSIYEITMKTLAQTVVSGKCSPEETTEFTRGTRGAEFLFAPDMNEYLTDMRKKLYKLRGVEAARASVEDDTERKQSVAQARELRDYFEEQVREGVPTRFRKYLDFAHLT